MRLFCLTFTALTLTACNSGHPTYVSTNAPASAQITVSATGKVSQTPDRASVSAGVITQAKTADAAMSANASKMNAAFEELRKAGIKEKNIRTSQMSLNPRYSYQDRRSPKIESYEVRNTISATVEELTKVGDMLDALVKAGVNNINNVQFSISNPDIAKASARDKAIKSAKEKAGTMASAAGVSLGDLLAISENSQGGFVPQPMAYARAAAVEFDAAPTPIAAGEQNLSVTVSLTYEIKN